MKSTGFIACAVVSADCIQRAMGQQSLFTSGFVWLWWVIAVVWGLSAVGFLMTDR